jgi:hypothetical protein
MTEEFCPSHLEGYEEKRIKQSEAPRIKVYQRLNLYPINWNAQECYGSVVNSICNDWVLKICSYLQQELAKFHQPIVEKEIVKTVKLTKMPYPESEGDRAINGLKHVYERTRKTIAFRFLKNCTRQTVSECERLLQRAIDHLTEEIEKDEHEEDEEI